MTLASISAYIAVNVGTSAAFIAPVIAVCLGVIKHVGLKAWCAAIAEQWDAP